MTERYGPPIEHSVWIDAEPDVVFSYFTDPAKLVTWMGSVARLEPVAGGPYRVVFKEGWVSAGQFVEVVRPHRLVYTVGWEGNQEFPPGSTRVEITFRLEAGGTRLELRHFGPPAQGLESTGWKSYLSRLAAAAEQRPMSADPFEDLIQRRE